MVETIGVLMIRKCPACLGENSVTCITCQGKAEMVFCDFCNKEICPPPVRVPICETCELEKGVVYQVDPVSSHSDLIKGKSYMGTVKKLMDFGFFIELNPGIRGLLRKRDTEDNFKEGDEALVKMKSFSNNKLDFMPSEADPENYTLVPLKKHMDRTLIGDIDEKRSGDMVNIKALVTQVQQTSGPTIFTLIDESGAIEGAAFLRGKRAYPTIDADDLVSLAGEASIRMERLQIEIKAMEKIKGNEHNEISRLIEDSIDVKSMPEPVDFLIKSEILEKLRPGFIAIAREIRRAIFTGVPIVIRHHADADGYTGGIALERSIIPLLQEFSPDSAGENHLIRRSPSKAPFYELEDVTRDLNFAHEDMRRFGQKMPMIILLDNGSTREDIPSIRKFKVYGSRVLVVDHHYPGEVVDGRVEVDDYVDHHVNPYLVGGDYSITAGCLGTELARFVNQDITDKLRHLPGIAVTADRAQGPEVDAYVEIAREKGHSRDELLKIAEAIDFEAYFLRFMDGRTLIEDLMGLNRLDRHRNLVEISYNEAMKRKDIQMKSVLPNTRTVKLPNGLVLNTIDLEMHAHRFTFPPPGKTCGMVHDIKVIENSPSPVVTIGYGPDFAILRAMEEVARNYGLNLNVVIKDLDHRIPQAGIDGGGHEVAGSIKFVEGYRKEVLERFAESISNMKVKK